MSRTAPLVLLAALALCLVVACGSSARTVVSLRHAQSSHTLHRAASELERQRGVQGTRSDLGSAEIEVEYDPDEVRPDDLVRRARAAGYDVVLGPGQGSYAERKTAFPDEVDVATISRAGEEVKLEQHLAAGKITVFDFYADWCEPCVIIDQELFSIVTRHGDVAVRKVNVVDWDTPVAARYLSRVPELPYLIVYAPDGRRVASLSGVRVPALRKAIAQARGGKLAEAP